MLLWGQYQPFFLYETLQKAKDAQRYANNKVHQKKVDTIM